MSQDPLFFKNEESPLSEDQMEEKSIRYQTPEFVLIDDRQGKSQYSYFKTDASHTSFKMDEEKSSSQGGLSLRFMCLLGLIFCLIFGCGMLIGALILTFLATLSLFRNQSLNQEMGRFWKMSLNTLIVGFGFLLGLLSPTLGLGFIALYFSFSTQLVNDDILRQMIRKSFSNF